MAPGLRAQEADPKKILRSASCDYMTSFNFFMNQYTIFRLNNTFVFLKSNGIFAQK